MKITRQVVLGVGTLSTITAFLAFNFFYDPDPLSRFVQDCSRSTKIVEETHEDGSVTYLRVLNSVEEAYIVAPDGKAHRLCVQIDSGAGGLTVDKRLAESWGLRERGKVIPVRSANGRTERKSIDVILYLAGEFYPEAVATKIDRTGLSYAANAGRKFVPKGAIIDPTRPEVDFEETEAEEREN